MVCVFDMSNDLLFHRHDLTTRISDGNSFLIVADNTLIMGRNLLSFPVFSGIFNI